MKLYKAHYKGMSSFSDVTIDIYALNMKEAWIVARNYKTELMLDEIYPTDDNWS